MLAVYLNNNVEDLNIQEELAKVSDQRRIAALRYRHENDRRLSLAVYRLLHEALKTHYGITEPPEFAFNAYGKPWLKDYPQIHFNLSHCRRAALCVVADQAVGCDIETIGQGINIDLCNKCFNAEETNLILQSDNPPLTFAKLWTKKEAFLKLIGKGLTEDIRSALTSAQARTAQFNTYVAQDNTYVYTICTASYVKKTHIPGNDEKIR